MYFQKLYRSKTHTKILLTLCPLPHIDSFTAWKETFHPILSRWEGKEKQQNSNLIKILLVQQMHLYGCYFGPHLIVFIYIGKPITRLF